MSTSNEYKFLEQQIRILKAALRSVDGVIDFNKAAYRAGLTTGDWYREQFMNCFDDSEPIKINTSIIGDGPSARVPYAAAKTAKLTLQHVGPEIAQLHANGRDLKTKPRIASPTKPRARVMPFTAEKVIDDSESDLESMVAASDKFDPGKPRERAQVEGKYEETA